MMPSHTFIDRTDQIFDRLTVISRAENSKSGKVRWTCKCSCGKITVVCAGNLTSKCIKSCGCLKKENAKHINASHKMSKSREYIIWCHIIDRCYNPSCKSFKDYGCRGIAIHKDWRHDFMAFYNHIGKRPSPKHSIDRINNDGNYEPGNVRWATSQEQNDNSSHNNNITLYGWTMSASNWARFAGNKPKMVAERIRAGWPPAKAIFQKAKHLQHPCHRSTDINK